MAELHTQGNEILVSTPDQRAGARQSSQPGQPLTSWIMGRVNKWEDFRNMGYNRLWAEYWRMWRGRWSPNDRNRLSERSRLIAPALAQAIEMTVAEIEEAVFAREQWFDIADNIKDENKLDAILARDQLTEDLELANVKDSMSEAVLNASIFGTGILKIAVEVIKDMTPVRNPDTLRLEAVGNDKVQVSWEAIRPDEFIPDPSGTKISEMLGVAHKLTKPLHAVLEKIERGTYRKDALPWLAPMHRDKTGHEVDFATEAQANQTLGSHNAETVVVHEYHGKVPLQLLDNILNDAARTPLDIILSQNADGAGSTSTMGDGPLVEAIVTIANGSVLLRAMKNPFTMKDRSIIAFQFEKVPGRFWGRGVAEKGYNPQKALDAEMRARIDALGYISSPMLGVDSGRIPRGFKMEIKPGKVWLTQGKPSEVIVPLNIGNLQPNTFNQTQELLQMVQMGTGAFDTATSLKSQSQSGGSGATTSSVFLGAFVKRSKRAIQNIDRNALKPAIRKSMLRYMQYDPRRYPTDASFTVKATLGIVAREVEQLNLTQLMAMLPSEFPQVGIAVAQGIIDLSNVTNKAQIVEAMEAATAPPSEEEQARQKEMADLQFEQAKAEATTPLLLNQKTIAEIRKILAEATVFQRRANVEDDKVAIEIERVQLQQEEIDNFEEQNRIALKRLDLQEKQVDARIQQMKRTGNSSS